MPKSESGLTTLDEDFDDDDDDNEDEDDDDNGLYTKLCQWVPFLKKKFLLI